MFWCWEQIIQEKGGLCPEKWAVYYPAVGSADAKCTNATVLQVSESGLLLDML